MKKFFIIYAAIILIVFCLMNISLEADELGYIDTSKDLVNVKVTGAVVNEKSYQVPKGYTIQRVLLLAIVLPEGEIDTLDMDKVVSNNSTIKVPYKYINVNTSSAEVMAEYLKGVGVITAGKIVDYRDVTPFKTIDDFKRVFGTIYENNKDKITI